MAKRRRCRDKLPHHEHEWGQDPDGQKSFFAIPGKGGRARFVAQSFWCTGVKLIEKEQE